MSAGGKSEVKGPKCSCDSFERLEGTSVPSYISAFLDAVDDVATGKNHYRCRVCGRHWEKRPPETRTRGARPSLVRLN